MRTKLFFSQQVSLLYALEEIGEQISQSKEDYDFFIISIHPSFNYEDVNFIIEKTLSSKKYVAFHAIDSFHNDKIVEKAVNCLAIKFEREGKLHTFYVDDILKQYAIEEAIDYFNSNHDKFHIVLAGVSGNKFNSFLEEVSSKINYYPVNNIIGGISSGFEIGGETLTYQFIDGRIIKNGFVVISFENVDTAIDISLGFVPYGITYEIDKARDRELFTVDGGKSFREIVANLLQGIDTPDVKYLWYLPINILDDNGYVATLRTPVKLKENSVEFFAPIKRGQKFKLSFATPDELIAEDKKCARTIKEKLKYVELAFNFSCVARQYVLEDRQLEEVQTYASILDSHLFGFFTFGEIGPDRQFKNLKLYNETSLIVGMREK